MDAIAHRDEWDRERVIESMQELGRAATLGEITWGAGIGTFSVEAVLKRLMKERRVTRSMNRDGNARYRLVPPPGLVPPTRPTGRHPS